MHCSTLQLSLQHVLLVHFSFTGFSVIIPFQQTQSKYIYTNFIFYIYIYSLFTHNIFLDLLDLLDFFFIFFCCSGPLVNKFLKLFQVTFPKDMNLSFLNLIRKACNKKNWIKLEKGLNKAVTMAIQVHHNGIAPEIQPETDEDEDEDEEDDNDNLEVDAEERQDRKGKKKQRKMSRTDTAKNDKLIKLSHQWTEFSNEVLRFSKKRSQIEQSFVFSFEDPCNDPW